MSEEHQINAEALVKEASEQESMFKQAEEELKDVNSTELTIETALLFYRNLRFDINENVKRLASPFNYDKKGKHTSRKNESKKFTDLQTLSLIIVAVANDIEPNPEQFETSAARELYGQLMLVNKAKEVIKADLRAKILAGDASTNGVSEELKQKVLKEI
jgi:hypothetical protein